MDRYILVEGRFEAITNLVKDNLNKFKKDINDKIAEGYIPLGSPIIEVDTPWIMQAMVKKEVRRGFFSHPNPLA